MKLITILDINTGLTELSQANIKLPAKINFVRLKNRKKIDEEIETAREVVKDLMDKYHIENNPTEEDKNAYNEEYNTLLNSEINIDFEKLSEEDLLSLNDIEPKYFDLFYEFVVSNNEEK